MYISFLLRAIVKYCTIITDRSVEPSKLIQTIEKSISKVQIRKNKMVQPFFGNPETTSLDKSTVNPDAESWTVFVPRSTASSNKR